MKKKTIISILLVIAVFSLKAQSKKTIRSNDISSQTVYEYFIGEGLKEPVVETITSYDSVGNVIELKEYNKGGEVKTWERYSYDSNGNKIEEIRLDAKGEQDEREVWIYTEGLLTGKEYYDKRDRLYKRKEYKYEYRVDN